MHKLGLSPICCEDFSTSGDITDGISVDGRPLSVMKVLCNLREAKAKQQNSTLNNSNNMYTNVEKQYSIDYYSTQ